MKPSERLKEIEENLEDILAHSSDCSDSDKYRIDVPWLIARVKTLTETLEGYSHLPNGRYNGPDDIYEDLGESAREALEGDE